MKRHLPAFFFSGVVIAAALYLGFVCQRIPNYYPLPTPSVSGTLQPYTLYNLLGIPEEPDWTPLPDPTRVAAIPTQTPKPAPTYDNTPIPDDLDGPQDDDYFAQAVLVCHYDDGEVDGYHFWMGPRQYAAHMAQHPNDYRELNPGTWCRDLPAAFKKTWRPFEDE